MPGNGKKSKGAQVKPDEPTKALAASILASLTSADYGGEERVASADHAYAAKIAMPIAMVMKSSQATTTEAAATALVAGLNGVLDSTRTKGMPAHEFPARVDLFEVDALKSAKPESDAPQLGMIMTEIGKCYIKLFQKNADMLKASFELAQVKRYLEGKISMEWSDLRDLYIVPAVTKLQGSCMNVLAGNLPGGLEVNAKWVSDQMDGFFDAVIATVETQLEGIYSTGKARKNE